LRALDDVGGDNRNHVEGERPLDQPIEEDRKGGNRPRYAPTMIAPSQYGWPAAAAAQSGLGSAPYSNTLIVDDTLPDQFLHSNNFTAFVTNPAGAVPSSARITQYTRGLIPRPDPSRGVPILAILGVGQNSTPSLNMATFIQGTGVVPGASWATPQNQRTLAQINVLERARFVLP
jgi:hypothetical protein